MTKRFVLPVPCKKCGGNAVSLKSPEGWQIACKACKTRTEIIPNHGKAIKAWNRMNKKDEPENAGD